MPVFSRTTVFSVHEVSTSPVKDEEVNPRSSKLLSAIEEEEPGNNQTANNTQDLTNNIDNNDQQLNAGISYVTINQQGISDDVQNKSGNSENKNTYSYNNSKNFSFGIESNVAKWSSHNFYRVVLLVSLVGFASWWRFPATAYGYHEGTFVFVYIILWLFIGVPISLLEQAIGQFSGKGPFRVWSCVPLFRGLAFAQCATSMYMAVIFGVLVGWCGLYFTASLYQTPTWQSFDEGLQGSESFLMSEILHLAPMENISHLYWEPIVSFAVCWVLVVLISISKISVFEKLMVVPCVIFFVGTITLFVYACTMDNIYDGAMHFLQPKWEFLRDGKVWYAALTQLVFTEVIGLGVLISLSSRNEFKWHLYISSSVCSLIGLIVCLCLGIANFCIVSHFSQTDVKDGSKPVQLGYGLMFVSILETTRNIEAVSPRLWTALVFVLIFVAGLGCCASAIFNMKTILIEVRPSFKEKQYAVVVILGIVCMVLSIPFATEGSMFFVAITDMYGISVVAVGCLFFETLGLTWIYGTNNLFDDFQLLKGWAIFFVWVVSIAAAAPVLILGVVVFAFVGFEPPTLGMGGVYPIAVWGHALGAILIALPLVLFVGWIVYVTNKQYEYGVMGKLKSAMRPSYSWGPAGVQSHVTWLARKTASYKYNNLGAPKLAEQNGSAPATNSVTNSVNSMQGPNESNRI